MRLVVYILLSCAAPAAWAQGEATPDHAGGEVIVVPPVDTRSGKPGDLLSPEARHADADRALRESGFVTVVRLDERAGETVTMGEVVGDTVGAHVRSLGGLGSFSSLSVRGASPGHTAVVVDGVALARLGSVTADLGRFDPGAFSLVALHRGAVPVHLGGAAQASALELTTALGPAPDGRPLQLSAGAGSFGARHLRGRTLGGNEELGYHLGLGYTGAEGDFDYFNDNGTNLNQTDDETTTRQNNGYDQVDALARLGALAGGARSQWRAQGVPGSASVQSERTSLTTWSQMLDGSAVRPLGGVFTARAGAQALIELQRYRDLEGEIGLASQDRRYLTAATGARVGLDAALGRQLASAGAEVGLDLFDDTDLMNDSVGQRGRRWLFALSAADAISLGRASLVPAVRVDLHRTDPIDQAMPNRTDLHASPRLSLLVRLSPDLTAKLDAGRYLRAPTAIELFGDRGFVVGNPDLRVETGESGDAGIILAPAMAGPIDRLYLEAAAFAARSRDTIVLVPTAALVAGAQNLGTATTWGGELVASLRAARLVTFATNYTLLRSRQRDSLPAYEGKELPQRPRHQLHGRVDVAIRLLERLGVVWGDADLVSGNTLDPANLDRVPRRTLFGAGIKLELVSGLTASLEGKNLGDQRVEEVPLDPPPRPDLTSAPRAVSDFFGYPLPGRAFYLTLQWET
jgi:vitamin B12 transporter